MRRLIMLITVFAAALLGGAAAAVPAQAKVPGPNGQIICAVSAPTSATSRSSPRTPMGPARSSSCPALRSVRAGHRTGPRILVCATKPGGLLRQATVRRRRVGLHAAG